MPGLIKENPSEISRLKKATALCRNYLEEGDRESLDQLSKIALGGYDPARRLIRFIETRKGVAGE